MHMFILQHPDFPRQYIYALDMIMRKRAITYLELTDWDF